MPQYRRSKTHTFVNPYCFVSGLSEKDSGKHRENVSGREAVEKLYGGKEPLKTGVLHCQITTHTPLAIPDVDKKEQRKEDPKEHFFYPFFRTDDMPVIPGSSIRGMLRSLYETATDSCFVTMGEEEWLTQRVSSRDPYQPGILRKSSTGTWELFPAKRYRLPVKRSPFQVQVKDKKRIITDGTYEYKNGSAVLVTTFHKQVTLRNGKTAAQTIVQSMKPYPVENTEDMENLRKNGPQDYLYIGEPIFNKNNESVFHCTFRDGKAVSREAMAALENTVLLYQNPSINRNLGESTNTGYASYQDTKKGGIIPLWYKYENDRLYLSMAAIGRKSYNNTVNTLVGEKYQPCRKRDALCPACRLFGMAKEEAFGGRVRITDAVLGFETSEKAFPPVTLQELGSPRTGYLPFYSINGLEYDASGANIAGRKYYWHIAKAEQDSSIYDVQKLKKEEQKTNRNATLELVPPKQKFTFDLYYDGITAEQLNQLKWVLTLGENTADSVHMQKLGHGKPLGLGSVKIQILSDTVRAFSVEEGYVQQSVELPDTMDIPAGIKEKFASQLLKISDYHLMDEEEVRYPFVELAKEVHLEKGKTLKENVLANHQWFTSNKGRSKYDPAPLQIPAVNSETHTLFAYEATGITDRDYKMEKNFHSASSGSGNKDRAKEHTPRNTNFRRGDRNREQNSGKRDRKQ
ncbi:MAG: TIGR03986 family CRISPR-associated RAMP protein [Lachnospiraceae bacterium]|nr:TIGR03986 family CRISPR-associated RAMP protein [Lachnospiraceae bacterium]